MPLPVIPPFLAPFLGPLLRKTSREKATVVLSKPSVREPILTRMRKEGVLGLGTRQAIRWCLYWQCKALLSSVGLKSGTVADAVRDSVDDKVIEEVASVGDYADAYDRTAAALINVVW